MFVDQVLESSTFIGKLEITPQNRMRFTTPYVNASGKRNMKFFTDFGDMVYFMFVKGKLMKIGKAAGAGGWYSRMGMYQQGSAGDQTNKLILRVMKELGENTIDIYAVQSPRQTISVTCPITGYTYEPEVETAKDTETRLTQMFLTESSDNQLPFSVQLK